MRTNKANKQTQTNTNRDFSGNYLNGTIGTQFNNLKKLSTLRLSKNLLSGSIDSSLFESIPNLEVL